MPSAKAFDAGAIPLLSGIRDIRARGFSTRIPIYDRLDGKLWNGNHWIQGGSP